MKDFSQVHLIIFCHICVFCSDLSFIFLGTQLRKNNGRYNLHLLRLVLSLFSVFFFFHQYVDLFFTWHLTLPFVKFTYYFKIRKNIVLLTFLPELLSGNQLLCSVHLSHYIDIELDHPIFCLHLTQWSGRTFQLVGFSHACCSTWIIFNSNCCRKYWWNIDLVTCHHFFPTKPSRHTFVYSLSKHVMKSETLPTLQLWYFAGTNV